MNLIHNSSYSGSASASPSSAPIGGGVKVAAEGGGEETSPSKGIEDIVKKKVEEADSTSRDVVGQTGGQVNVLLMHGVLK